MIARKVLRRLRRPCESGMTLIETVVALGLLSLMLGFVLTGVAALQRDATGGDRRLQNLDEARVLRAVMTKDLRTATRLTPGGSAFTIAKDREVTFYANVDNSTNGPNKVHIYVDVSSELIEEVAAADPGSAPNYTYLTQTPAVRFVGRYIANTIAQPILIYYDTLGNVLGPTPLTAAQVLSLDAVGIYLSIKKTTSLPVLLATFALMGLVAATLAYAIGSQPLSRHDQDWNAALAAANSGVDDYLYRLNQDGNYWLWTTAVPDPSNLAFTQFVPIAGPANEGLFRYNPDATTIKTDGTIKLTVTGKVRKTLRTVKVTLRRRTVIDYLYFTDYETMDPRCTRGARSRPRRRRRSARSTTTRREIPCARSSTSTRRT